MAVWPHEYYLTFWRSRYRALPDHSRNNEQDHYRFPSSRGHRVHYNDNPSIIPSSREYRHRYLSTKEPHHRRHRSASEPQPEARDHHRSRSHNHNNAVPHSSSRHSQTSSYPTSSPKHHRHRSVEPIPIPVRQRQSRSREDYVPHQGYDPRYGSVPSSGVYGRQVSYDQRWGPRY
jgi:hypothetical protein